MTDIDAASFPVWCAILIVAALIAWAHTDRSDP
jgi:hypothetical protein